MTGKKKEQPTTEAPAAEATAKQDLHKVTWGEVQNMTPEQLKAWQEAVLDDIHMQSLFDSEAYSSTKQLKKAVEQLAAPLNTVVNEYWVNTANKLVETIKNSDVFKNLLQVKTAWTAYYEAHKDEIDAIVKATQEIDHKEKIPYIAELAPFILQELAAEQGIEDPGQVGFNYYAAVLRQGFDNDGHIIPDSKFANLISRAIKRKSAMRQSEKALQKLDDVANALRVNIPKDNIIITNNLMRTMQTEPVVGTGKPFDWAWTKRGKAAEMTNRAVMYFDPEDPNIKIINNSLTEYDRQVFEAIITCYMNDSAFTLDVIYRIMTGAKSKVPPKQKEMIERSIARLKAITADIDFSNEARVRCATDDDGKPLDTVVFERQFLILDKIKYTVKTGKNSVKPGYKYRVAMEPPMVTYMKMNGQFKPVDRKMLTIKEVDKDKGIGAPISNTPELTEISGYMFRTINIMKQKKKDKVKWTNTILLDSMFDGINHEHEDPKPRGVNAAAKDDPKKQAEEKDPEKVAANLAARKRQLKHKMVNLARKCLDYWVHMGYIHGYRVSKADKNKILGFDIILDDPNEDTKKAGK